MRKLEPVLLTFFSKPLLDILLPAVVNAENTPLQGNQKKELVLKELECSIKTDDVSIVTETHNLKVPWRILFPIIIDAILAILNAIVGKKWIRETGDPTTPPRK